MKTPQQQQAQQTVVRDLAFQQNLKPSGARGFSDASLQSLAKELYDSTDSFRFNYPIILRSWAYYKRMTNADAQTFLKIFSNNFGITVYQWYVDKFKNTWNFERITFYPVKYPKYFEIFKLMGYKTSMLNFTFDKLAEICTGYLYNVAKVPKG